MFRLHPITERYREANPSPPAGSARANLICSRARQPSCRRPCHSSAFAPPGPSSPHPFPGETSISFISSAIVWIAPEIPVRHRCEPGDTPVCIPWGALPMGYTLGLHRVLAGATPCKRPGLSSFETVETGGGSQELARRGGGGRRAFLGAGAGWPAAVNAPSWVARALLPWRCRRPPAGSGR